MENENLPNAMPVNKGGRRVLDNRVMETLHALRKAEGHEPFDTVIGYFAEGSPIYEGAELRHQNHLQICVRNPACLKGYFLLPKVGVPLAASSRK
ncbi:MAG: hypothetical protein ACKVY0_27165 [Prosthecobacter sp.]|uniref:hypothetical protein n=1 Tax=Prosthecobacter sp. TaxID=1965333 RepID=UPI0039002C50